MTYLVGKSAVFQLLFHAPFYGKLHCLASAFLKEKRTAEPSKSFQRFQRGKGRCEPTAFWGQSSAIDGNTVVFWGVYKHDGYGKNTGKTLKCPRDAKSSKLPWVFGWSERKP